MQYSNTNFYLLSKIQISDTIGATFNISNETENDTPIDTAWRKVSIVFKNKRQRERFIVTIVNGVCTIVKRGLSQVGGVDSVDLQKKWEEWELWYITALDFDILEKDSEVEQTITGDIKLLWNLDAGEMLSTNGFDYQVNGSNFRIRKDGNDLKFTDDNQSEVSLSSLAAAAWIDEKTKVSVNDTTAGYLDWKLTGWDGITLTQINDGGNESLDIDIDLADTTIFSTSWVANRWVVTDGSWNLFNGTTTKVWWLRISTPTEATEGTIDTVAMTPKGVSDNFRYKERVMVASANLKVSADTVRSNSTGTYTKVKEVLITRKWVIRVSYDLRRASASFSVVGEIRINGSVISSKVSSSSTYVTYTEDFTVAENDLIQLWIKGANDPVTCEIRNFRIYYDVSLIPIYTVNLD